MRKIEWKESNLSELCLFIRGVTFGKSDGKPAFFKDSIPVLRAGNIQERLDIENDLVFIPNRLVQEEQLLQHKDIVICLSSGSAHLVGKTAQLDSDFSGTIGAFCGIVRPKNKASAEFLKLWFKSDAFWSLRDSLADGASIQNLKFSQLENKKIKIPVNEQEIIDFSYELQNQLAFVESMRQAALKQKEAAKALQSAILREVFPWQVGESLPDGWRWEKITDISKNLDGKRIPVSEKTREKGNIPYYGASGIVDYVKDYLFDEDLLLVSEDGANLVMRTYPIAFSISGKTWVNNHAHVLKFENKDIQKITEYYINGLDISDFVSGAAQPKLNQDNLNRIRIPVPSDLQTRAKIVKKIEKEFLSANQIENQVDSQLAAIESLPAAILREAFNFQNIEN